MLKCTNSCNFFDSFFSDVRLCPRRIRSSNDNLHLNRGTSILEELNCHSDGQKILITHISVQSEITHLTFSCMDDIIYKRINRVLINTDDHKFPFPFEVTKSDPCGSDFWNLSHADAPVKSFIEQTKLHTEYFSLDWMPIADWYFHRMGKWQQMVTTFDHESKSGTIMLGPSSRFLRFIWQTHFRWIVWTQFAWGLWVYGLWNEHRVNSSPGRWQQAAGHASVYPVWVPTPIFSVISVIYGNIPSFASFLYAWVQLRSKT